MKLLRTALPYIIELELEEVTVFHLALYTYRDILKHNKRMKSNQKKNLLKLVNDLIPTIDLML